MLLVAGNEGEVLDVFVKFRERKGVRGAALLVEQRQVALFLRLQIVNGDARKVGDDDVARDFVAAAGIGGEFAEVLKRLRLSLAQIFAERFVFDEHDARPEEVNAPVVAGDFLDGFLEAGDDATFDAEDLKEFVPESLFLRTLAFDAGPIARKFDRVVPDFVPGNRHGCSLARESALLRMAVFRRGMCVPEIEGA